MEERAAIPLTLPRPTPTISYWQDPPDSTLSDFVSAESLRETADTVIVGSGITGTSIAYGLLGGDITGYPSIPKGTQGTIVMLEARQACSGATGRNGGHTKAASYRSFLDNAKTIGVEEAASIARLEYNTIKSLHSFARQHHIDCDLYSGDTVDIIYDKSQWETAVASIKAMREHMPDDLDGAAKYTFWSPEEAREKFVVKGEGCIGAVSYEAGSLSAYKFVCGVLRLCLKRGLELFTNTPVVNLMRKGEFWWVDTNRGAIKAKRVVLATNGYTGYLCERFRKVIVPLRGQITAHRPGSAMPQEGLPTTYSFIYDIGYEYMIPRPKGSQFEGDIIIGGGLVKAKDEGLKEYGTTDDTTVNSDISKYLTNTTPRYFGTAWGEDDKNGRIRKEWTGIMGYSSDGFPFIGEVPDEKDLWVAASFQGHGMVLCWLCARALVIMLAGNEGDRKRTLEWFPGAFVVDEVRMRKPFKGRLHTKPMEIEVKRGS